MVASLAGVPRPWFIRTGRCSADSPPPGWRREEMTEAVATSGDAGAVRAPAETSTAPKRAGLVLSALIAVAAVANLGLAVANVALPSIGEHFDASQTALNLVAVGYRPRVVGALLRRCRRPLRAQVAARPRHDPDHPGGLPRRLGALDRRAVRGSC